MKLEYRTIKVSGQIRTVIRDRTVNKVGIGRGKNRILENKSKNSSLI